MSERVNQFPGPWLLSLPSTQSVIFGVGAWMMTEVIRDPREKRMYVLWVGQGAHITTKKAEATYQRFPQASSIYLSFSTRALGTRLLPQTCEGPQGALSINSRVPISLSALFPTLR